jgi:hypothetical protein
MKDRFTRNFKIEAFSPTNLKFSAAPIHDPQASDFIPYLQFERLQ